MKLVSICLSNNADEVEAYLNDELRVELIRKFFEHVDRDSGLYAVFMALHEGVGWW